ncbi:MAG: CHASE2 domain-containing protein, partial [Candidatus Omnitrophica bacterium]|nr:CHASE2 domain-containing protein [Candidatus Omnitrophota bacterium]
MPSKHESDILHKLDELFVRQKREGFLYRFELVRILIYTVILGVNLFLLNSGILERVETLFLDVFFRQRPPLAAHPGIAVIEIDAESLQAIGPWPWPWKYHAQMIELLSGWQAKSVVFDFVFKDPEDQADETSLETAMRDSGRTFLAVDYKPKAEKKIWVHALPVVLEPGSEEKLWIHSPANLEKSAKGLGHHDLEMDQDGSLRKIKPFLTSQNETYPFLTFLAAYDFLGKSLHGPEALLLPMDSKGNLFISWSGPWRKTFQHYSYADLIRSSQALGQGLKPVIFPDALKDKICLIGPTAAGIAEFKITPLENNYPVLGVQAEITNNLLTGQFIRPPSSKIHTLVFILLTILAYGLFVTFRHVASFMAGLLVAAGWIGFSFYFFIQKGIWLFVFQPVLLILTLFIFSVIYDLVIERQERSRLIDLATRDGLTGLYVIRHFREILNRVVLESYRKKETLSLILIDIDNFKPVNDTYGHAAGDMVLKKTAQIIYSCFRS